MKLEQPSGAADVAPNDFPAFLLLDGRYWYDEDRAMLCSTAGSLGEAEAQAPSFGNDTAILRHTGGGNYEPMPHRDWDEARRSTR